MTKINQFGAVLLSVVVLSTMVVISPNLAYAKSAPIVEGTEPVSSYRIEKTVQPKEWVLPSDCKDDQARMLFEAGFNRPGMLRGAWAITWRESNHQSLSENSPWYSGALGTWQIQTSAWSGRSWWSRDNMLDKETQSKIVRKHFLNGGMHNWGYGYSFKTDTWYEDAGMYYSLWGSGLTYSWVIAPFERAWANYPKKCTPIKQ